MRIRGLVTAVLTVPVLIGGLLLVTAGPAAACSCGQQSQAQAAAQADAVFVGRLVDRVDPPQRPMMSSSDPATLTFDVSRVYKGTVTARQEIVTAMSGASCGLELTGEGPFVVFGQRLSYERYQLEPGQYAANLCGGSRALCDGGEPVLGVFTRRGRPHQPEEWTTRRSRQASRSVPSPCSYWPRPA
jgi:hypothetical protein